MRRHRAQMAGQMPALRRVEHPARRHRRARAEKRPFPIVGGRQRASGGFVASERGGSAAPAHRHGRAGPRARRRAGGRRGDSAGRRPRHRQIHPAAANRRQNGAEPQGAVCVGRGIGAAGCPARAAAGAAQRGHQPAGGNPLGGGSGCLKAAPARAGGHRFHPNHVFRPNHLRARQRVAGARVRRTVHPHRQADGYRYDFRRPRYQRRRHRRPARAGTHGGHRALF